MRRNSRRRTRAHTPARLRELSCRVSPPAGDVDAEAAGATATIMNAVELGGAASVPSAVLQVDVAAALRRVLQHGHGAASTSQLTTTPAPLPAAAPRMPSLQSPRYGLSAAPLRRLSRRRHLRCCPRDRRCSRAPTWAKARGAMILPQDQAAKALPLPAIPAMNVSAWAAARPVPMTAASATAMAPARAAAATRAARRRWRHVPRRWTRRGTPRADHPSPAATMPSEVAAVAGSGTRTHSS